MAVSPVEDVYTRRSAKKKEKQNIVLVVDNNSKEDINSSRSEVTSHVPHQSQARFVCVILSPDANHSG